MRGTLVPLIPLYLFLHTAMCLCSYLSYREFNYAEHAPTKLKSRHIG